MTVAARCNDASMAIDSAHINKPTATAAPTIMRKRRVTARRLSAIRALIASVGTGALVGGDVGSAWVNGAGRRPKPLMLLD